MHETAASSRAWLVVPAVAVGLAGIACLIVISRSLGTADFAAYLMCWGIFFTALAAPVGAQPALTSMLSPSGGSRRADAYRASTPVALASSLVAGTGCGLVVGSWVIGACAFSAALAFATGSVVIAHRAAVSSWRSTSALASLEPLTRLVATIVVARHADVRVAVLAMLSGALVTGLAVLASGGARSSGSASRVGARRGVAWVSAAAAGPFVSGIVLAGFPLLAYGVARAPRTDSVAAVLLALALARGVVLLPLAAFQNAIVEHVVSARPRSARQVPWLASSLVVVGGVLVAWLAGPRLVQLLNPSFAVTPLQACAAWTAAVSMACVTVTGLVRVARGRGGPALVGWLVATAVVVGVMAMPVGPPLLRTFVALHAGPLSGALVHCAGARPTRPGARVGATLR